MSEKEGEVFPLKGFCDEVEDDNVLRNESCEEFFFEREEFVDE